MTVLPDATALPTLTTSRLRLRLLGPADAPALLAIFSDPEVTRYWSMPPLVDLADARALAERIVLRFHERTLLQWGITRADDDRVLGTCTLADLDLAHRRAGLGYALARAAWGQGIAREAAAALLAFGFSTLDLHRISADIDPRNHRSERLLTALGFAPEGLQRECYRVMDEWQDAAMFGLLRRDWRP